MHDSQRTLCIPGGESCGLLPIRVCVWHFAHIMHKWKKSFDTQTHIPTNTQTQTHTKCIVGRCAFLRTFKTCHKHTHKHTYIHSAWALVGADADENSHTHSKHATYMHGINQNTHTHSAWALVGIGADADEDAQTHEGRLRYAAWRRREQCRRSRVMRKVMQAWRGAC